MKIARLKKLADHLLNGKLGHENFDFSCFNDGDIDKNGCGTLGCAIGECPIVFPKHWHFEENNYMFEPHLIGSDRWSELDDACEFFGISDDAACHLFVPNDQDTYAFGGSELGRNATKEQVAANILSFINHFKNKANEKV